MTKKLLFWLLFNTLCFPIFKANTLVHHKNELSSEDPCNIPAPSDFRITSMSTDEISLAWNPEWEGAKHTLTVFVKDSFDTWNPVKTYFNVLGSSYTIANLEPASDYKFSISTNCVSGQISEKKAEILTRRLIMDLLLYGRVPEEPVEIGCANVDYTNYNWIGFKVEPLLNSATEEFPSFFEIVVEKGNMPTSLAVRRVFYDHPIVAANSDNIWPVYEDSMVESNTKFWLEMQPGPPVGSIIASILPMIHYSPLSVDLCAEKLQKNYKITFLSAESANLPAFANLPNERHIPSYEDDSDIEVQNPFSETLKIFFPFPYQKDQNFSVSMVDLSGHIILKQNFHGSNEKIIIPTSLLLPGMYILKIESNQIAKVFKVVK